MNLAIDICFDVRDGPHLVDHFQATRSCSKSHLLIFMFQTGETMGGVDLTTNLPMGGTANATQMQMQMRKVHAVPKQAGAGTVVFTVEMEAPTSVLVSLFLRHTRLVVLR